MVDITVRGAGIFGLSVAWTCLRRGASVRVIDPKGVGGGASGGLVGALAPHIPENWNAKKAFQFDSLMMALPFWNGVEAASGLPSGYARSGRLQPVENERGLELARAREDSAKALWQGQATWQVIRAGQSKWEPASATGWLIHDTLSARMAPRLAGASLAGAIVKAGGKIVEEGPEEGKTIWATGVQGLNDLSSDLGQEVGNGVKGQGALLEYGASDLPQLFAGGVHIVPHVNGTVAIGSTSERDYSEPDTVDEQLEDVIAKARAACPALMDAPVVERWAGVRPRAKSRAPMLGPWPDREGHFVMNGGFKIGFGMAPKLAQVMADLVLDGHDAIPQGFRVSDNL